ncbi:MAG: efflux RND transporter periplasmic adaptor subunit [Dehalococcoidales bacterium]
MKNWGIVAVLVVGLILVSLSACGQADENQYQLVEVVPGDLMVTVSGSGNIEVSNEAYLAFGVGGTVGELYVEEGDEVIQGQALASLDTSSLELALKTAEIDLEIAASAFREITYPYTYHTLVLDIPASTADISDAQWQLTKAQEVLEIGLSYDQYWEVWNQLRDAQQNLVEAKANIARGYGADLFGTGILRLADYWTLRAAQLGMEKYQIALDEANNNLEEAVIFAPFDGVVASVDVKVRDVVPPPTLTLTTVIHLIDLTTMELTAEVDEIDIALVKPGQEAIIEVDALPALQLDAEVISISLLPEVEEGVVLYEVGIGFDVPEVNEVKVGMSATADIIIHGGSGILLVPDRAIEQDSEGNPVVKVMVNEEIEERPVVTGISDGYQTEIVDGLSEGEIVVIER